MIATPPPDASPRHQPGSWLMAVSLTDLAFFAFLVMVVTSPISTDTTHSGVYGLSGQGSMLRQVAYLGIFSVLLLATGAFADMRIWNRFPPALYLVLLLCWASLTWSVDPSVAFRRVTLLTIVCLSALLGVERLGIDKIVLQIRAVLALACAFSFAAVLALPQIGIHQLEPLRDPALLGDWRGIFPEKNYAGLICALTILFWFFGPPGRSRWLRWAVIAAAAVFLVKTNSKTSIALAGAVIAAGYVYRGYNQRDWKIILITAATATLASIMAIIWNWEKLLAPLEKQDTLTGRSQIWRVLISYISDHGLLGAGFGSFWNVGPDSPVYHYAPAGSWIDYISSGHNGYLDVAAQLGLPGLALVVFALMVSPLASLLSGSDFRNQPGTLFFAVIAFVIGHNATESTLLDRDQLLQVLLVIVGAAIHRTRLLRSARGKSPQRPRWFRSGVPEEAGTRAG